MKRWTALTTVVAAVAVAGAARAGWKVNETVSINTTYRYAYGALRAAHDSADFLQYIGCDVSTWTNTSGTFSQVGCYARDPAGSTAYCATSDPQFVSALGAVSGDSEVEFWWDQNGHCTSVLVHNESEYGR
jgi:hypothetical protein